MRMRHHMAVGQDEAVGRKDEARARTSRQLVRFLPKDLDIYDPKGSRQSNNRLPSLAASRSQLPAELISTDKPAHRTSTA
jgi:hypothetical protein